MSESPYASIKLSRTVVDELRDEAAISSRSVAAQAEHWIKLGRAYESTQGVTTSDVRTALTEPVKMKELNADQRRDFLRNLTDAFRNPSPEVRDAYAQMGARQDARSKARTSRRRGGRAA